LRLSASPSCSAIPTGISELKHDGFRALAYFDGGTCTLDLAAADLAERRFADTLGMADPIPPMPDWALRLWERSEHHRRLFQVLDTLEPHEARALFLFLRDHEDAYRPILPPTSETPR
jgi:hypothetical protein